MSERVADALQRSSSMTSPAGVNRDVPDLGAVDGPPLEEAAGAAPGGPAAGR